MYKNHVVVKCLLRKGYGSYVSQELAEELKNLRKDIIIPFNV